MHTRAAEAQSLHKHLLAYVKQNPHTAKVSARFIVVTMMAFSFSCSACATLPRRAAVAGETSQTAHGSTPGLRININTASPQELERLPGIGNVMAERIVAHRAQYGPFRRAEHLMMVRGISDRKFRAIQSMIVVQ